MNIEVDNKVNNIYYFTRENQKNHSSACEEDLRKFQIH